MIVPIDLCRNGTTKGSNSTQPLVQWSEVPGHTGLMYSMTQTSNNPVVLMIQLDSIMVQEIKVVPAKAKVLHSRVIVTVQPQKLGILKCKTCDSFCF